MPMTLWRIAYQAQQPVFAQIEVEAETEDDTRRQGLRALADAWAWQRVPGGVDEGTIEMIEITAVAEIHREGGSDVPSVVSREE
jgi:hypothetical protein